MRTHLRALALAALALACTDGNATPARGVAPRFRAAEVVVVGPNVAVVITWRPGTTDSITFTASRPEAPDVARSGVKPFSGVDTLVLGLRPAPGVTLVWGVAAAYWWTDRAIATFGTASLGSTSYTEPAPAGTPPGFDPLPPADTTGSGPSASILELAIWPDSVTVAPGEVLQFCALARLSDAPGLWVALSSDSAGIAFPAPALCVAAAASRNPPAPGGSIG